MSDTFKKMSEMSSVGPTDDEERITAIALAGEVVKMAKNLYIHSEQLGMEDCFDLAEEFMEKSARYVVKTMKEYEDERKAKQHSEESEAAKEESGSPDAG